jgi:hypothetical protein
VANVGDGKKKGACLHGEKALLGSRTEEGAEGLVEALVQLCRSLARVLPKVRQILHKRTRSGLLHSRRYGGAGGGGVCGDVREARWTASRGRGRSQRAPTRA